MKEHDICFVIFGVVLLVGVVIVTLTALDTSRVVTDKPYQRPLDKGDELTGKATTNPCPPSQCYYSGKGKYCYYELETVDVTLPKKENNVLCIEKSTLTCINGEWGHTSIPEVIC